NRFFLSLSATCPTRSSAPGRACPVLSPGRVWLGQVSLGQSPSSTASAAGCPALFGDLHRSAGRALGAVNSLLRRSGWGVDISRFAPSCLAFDRGVDANDGVAALVEILVEAQHILPRRTCLPATHCVFGLEQVGQPIVAPAQYLVEQACQHVCVRAAS